MFQLIETILPGNPRQQGVSKTENGFNFAVVSKAESIELCLYKNDSRQPCDVVVMDSQYRHGSVFAVKLILNDAHEVYYNYRVNGVYMPDPYAAGIKGASQFGTADADTVYVSPVEMAEFDWGSDKRPHIPFEDIVIYKLHVRGFTKSAASGVTSRGTFKGITEKIQYLKELGITAVELMPVHEFEEVRKWTADDRRLMYNPRFNGKVNYWGYTGGLYFAPKAAYSSGIFKDSTQEFKYLVKTLHENGIEVFIEMYFDSDADVCMIHDCVRYWVLEYHIDGIHLICRSDVYEMIKEDPLLDDVKLFAPYWQNTGGSTAFGKHLANYNDGFMNTARKFLKGDENMLGQFVDAVKCNDENSANVNYIACNNGFTLMDLVSYDRKHNEVNGENNRDGADFNNSWNCGTEGHTRKKRILSLRIKQMKNALLMVMLSQGVPLIWAGDEMANTQDGNNNPYCQDNDISYLNWKNTAYCKEMFDFTKKLIAFRKAHGVFHQKNRLRDMDYMACGYPDISYHSENAWMANFENYFRNIGILYCGEYAQDNFMYVVYNMHWEKHDMALPALPEGCRWKCVFNTDNAKNDNNTCSISDDGNRITVMERSVIVLMGAYE